MDTARDARGIEVSASGLLVGVVPPFECVACGKDVELRSGDERGKYFAHKRGVGSADCPYYQFAEEPRNRGQVAPSALGVDPEPMTRTNLFELTAKDGVRVVEVPDDAPASSTVRRVQPRDRGTRPTLVLFKGLDFSMVRFDPKEQVVIWDVSKLVSWVARMYGGYVFAVDRAGTIMRVPLTAPRDQSGYDPDEYPKVVGDITREWIPADVVPVLEFRSETSPYPPKWLATVVPA